MRVNHKLDKFLNGRVVVGRVLPVYQFWLLAGMALAVALALTLAARTGLAVWVPPLLLAGAVITSLALALALKTLTGRERLTNYHHQIVATGIAGAWLWYMGQPVRAFLDLFALGLGTVAVCGRLGCLQAGCCHGRPHDFGVHYHNESGHRVLHSYGRTRLFPVQALESVWALVIVLGGVAFVLADNPPGSAFAWYVLLYAAGRFGIEYLRGDTGRPYYRGLSEPQWTSLALLALMFGLGLVDLLPLHAGYVLALAIVVASSLAALALRPLRPRDLVDLVGVITLSASVAEARIRLGGSGENVAVLQTEQGLRVSAGMLADADGRILQFAISHSGGRLAARDVRRVSALVRQYHPGEQTHIPGSHGVYHLLVRGA